MQSIFLSQRKYVMDLLKEAGRASYKPCATPIKGSHRLKEMTVKD